MGGILPPFSFFCELLAVTVFYFPTKKQVADAHTKVLSPLDHGIPLRAETEHSPRPAHLLSRILEAGEVPKVLCDTPCYLAAVNIGMVPVEQVLSVLDIFSNGLLRQNMLARGQCETDILGLLGNGKTGW